MTEIADKAARRDGRMTALIALHVSAVVFGSVALFGKIEASPVWIVAGRTAFAGLALFAAAKMRGLKLKIAPGQIGRTLATAILLALHWLTFFASIQWAGVAIGTLTVSTFPLFTILLEALFLRRRPALVEAAAGIVIVFAVALIAGPGLPATPLAAWGAGAGIAAAFLFALFALLSQSLAKSNSTNAILFHQCLLIFLLSLPALPFAPPLHGAAAWGLVAALGVFGTALAHGLYMFSLRRLPASVCGAAASLEPVYAIAFAALLFGDPVTPMILVSAALVVGALWLLLRRHNIPPP